MTAVALAADEVPNATVFAGWYREHYDTAHRWARTLGASSDQAEDVVQDAFIIAYRKRESFEPGRPFRPWLLGIVRRVLADRRRSARRARARDERSPELDPVVDLDRAVAVRRAHAFVETFLRGLPERQRLVFALCEIEGLKTPEAAEVLGAPAKTVRSRLRQAREKFADSIADLRSREEQQAP